MHSTGNLERRSISKERGNVKVLVKEGRMKDCDGKKSEG
jgi:hypothetical protein